jgi:hypothetical protein
MLLRYLTIATLTVSTAIFSGSIMTNISALAAPQKQVTSTTKHKFENYPASPIFKGTPAKLIAGNQAKDYLPAIQEVANKGTNFAGHYVIADGLNRAMGGQDAAAIADLKTGKIYLPQQLQGYRDQRGAGYTPPRPDGGLHYQANSKLLVITGRAAGNDGKKGIGHFYYKWQNNKLTFVKFISAPYQSQ